MNGRLMLASSRALQHSAFQTSRQNAERGAQAHTWAKQYDFQVSSGRCRERLGMQRMASSTQVSASAHMRADASASSSNAFMCTWRAVGVCKGTK